MTNLQVVFFLNSGMASWVSLNLDNTYRFGWEDAAAFQFTVAGRLVRRIELVSAYVGLGGVDPPVMLENAEVIINPQGSTFSAMPLFNTKYAFAGVVLPNTAINLRIGIPIFPNQQVDGIEARLHSSIMRAPAAPVIEASALQLSIDYD